MIKKIAVLTSGGDAPGMNAAIRGVVRSALAEGLEVFGIYDGYQGLYNNKIKQLNRYSVSDVINRGGTFLGSARFPEFKDPNIRAKCAEILRSHGIDALVVIGGDGSYMGAKLLPKNTVSLVLDYPVLLIMMWQVLTIPSVIKPHYKLQWMQSTVYVIHQAHTNVFLSLKLWVAIVVT